MYHIDKNICPQDHLCPLIADCPVEAISQQTPNSLPVINNDACIECGLCAANCPLGAVIKVDE